MHLVVTANRKAAIEFLVASNREADLPVDNVDEVDLEKMLHEIPIQNKNDLIDYVESNQSSLLENAVLFSETSGTTGRPLQTPRGAADLQWNTQNQVHAYSRILNRGQDRIAIIHPGMLSPFIEATTFALRQLEIGYVKLFPIEGICDYRRILEVLKRYEITAIMTTPSLALKVLYEVSKLDPSLNLNINKVLLTGELISESCVTNFKKILGQHCEVTAFVYGGSETASLMYGVGNGQYLPFLDDFIFEIVDGQTTSVSHDEYLVTGELCVTWLRAGLLPIKRYNTGDAFEVTVKKNQPYKFKPLGRSLRSENSLHMPPKLEEIIYCNPKPIFNYAIEIAFEEKKCTLSIVTTDTAEPLAGLRELVSNEMLGFEITLKINDPDDPFLAFAPKPKLTRFKILN